MYKLVVLIFLIALPSQIYANNKITVLAASDVSQKSIDITTDWLSIAEKEWFKKENPASKRFYPILLVLVGADMDAAIELVKDGYLGGVACDVIENAPYGGLEKARIPGVLLTPHAAGYSIGLGRRVAAGVINVLKAWDTGQALPYRLT